MSERIDFANFTFDRRRRELRFGEDIVSLPNKAIEALDVLISMAGRTVLKKELYISLWGDKVVSEGNLTQTIYLLRTALEKLGGKPLIKTIPGVGYVFVATVLPKSYACTMIESSVAAVVPNVSPNEATLASARRLLQRGHFDAAFPLLESLKAVHLDPDNAATMFALRARAFADKGNQVRALADLQAAQQIIGSLEKVEPSTELDTGMSRSYLSYRKGSYRVAIDVASEAIESVPTNLVRSRDTRMLAYAFIEVATQELEFGSTRKAREHLGRANALLQMLHDPPASERCQFLVQLSFACSASADAFPKAAEYAREAFNLAQRNHLDLEQVWAELALAVAAQCSGSLEDARAHARAALLLARVSLNGDPLARAYLLCSRIEAACGNGPVALDLLRRAWPLLKDDPLMRAIYSGPEARARRLLGDARGAERAATRGIETDSSNYVGISYNARAWARRARGATAAAILDVELAIDYLRRGGFLSDLESALRLSFEMTGRKSHHREAADLHSVLIGEGRAEGRRVSA